MKCDVAIIGGGPAGTTVGTLLRKHDPSLKVVIFESEKFPRDHVGESQLPAVPRILNEMGVWDKVEAANFPVKIGARYRWGPEGDDDFWNSYFIPDGIFHDQPRPGRYEGQRAMTAFQVDRAIYDKILLDHASECGCEVYEQTRAIKVVRDGDRIQHIIVRDRTGQRPDEVIEAKYYVDASGNSGLVREAMGVSSESPTSLRNIAIWDYWQNAEWGEKIGIGGTMVQVMSLSYGWLWFIPLGPTRTSLGLVTSAEYYKKSGKSTEELYLQAISDEPRISELVANGERENQLQATKDWSFYATRMCGENWFLAGDSSGFADPILAAGLTLAHMGAKRVAFSILELMRGEVDPEWIRAEYQRVQTKHVNNHIRFANYWYSANGKFTDLREYCIGIAKDAGLTLERDDAFQWLGTGGFADEMTGIPFAGTFGISAIKALAEKYSGQPVTWTFKKNNLFDLDLEGATESVIGVYENGRVNQVKCYFRDGKTLPVYLFYGIVLEALKKEREIRYLSERTGYQARLAGLQPSPELGRMCLEVLEVLVAEGWVKASYDPSLPLLGEKPAQH